MRALHLLAYPITSACRGACFDSIVGFVANKAEDIFFLRGPLDASSRL